MEDHHFKIIFGILWFVYSWIRFPHRLRYRKQHFDIAPHRNTEIVLAGLLLIGVTFLPMTWVFTDLFQEYSMDLSPSIRLGGLVIAAASLLLFHWVHQTLKENWSPTLEIRTKHQLVTSGPYRYVRHPMYTQIWIWCIAQVFITSNWIISFSALFTWSLLFSFRLKREERMLINQFGQQYLDYKQSTGAIFPKLMSK